QGRLTRGNRQTESDRRARGQQGAVPARPQARPEASANQNGGVGVFGAGNRSRIRRGKGEVDPNRSRDRRSGRSKSGSGKTGCGSKISPRGSDSGTGPCAPAR